MFFFQAEDGIRDLVRSRGLGDVYKRQSHNFALLSHATPSPSVMLFQQQTTKHQLYEEQKATMLSCSIERKLPNQRLWPCLLYTSDAADERSSVDLGGRRIIKKEKKKKRTEARKTKEKKRKQEG